MKRTLLAAALIGAASLAQAAGFTLTSPDIKANATIDKRFEANVFGCSGENKSPALKWSGAPKDTKSFAVTMSTPMRPRGWWRIAHQHPPNDRAEAGCCTERRAARRNRYARLGVAGWGGVCPPKATSRRHIFTKTRDIPADAAALAGFMINANSIAKASFTAKYGRGKGKQK
jgi:phosphatidylethanolamine-binding protein (PEBP) family uncharacterized protein